MQNLLRRFVALPLLAAALASATAGAQESIQLLASRPLLAVASAPWDGKDWLERFYAPRGYAPAWTRAQAEMAIALLRDAPSDGLEPDDYGAGALQRLLERGANPELLDVRLSAAMLHFLADLRLGRVRSEYHSKGPDEGARFDPVTLLRTALERGQLRDAVLGARPPMVLYSRVRDVLAQYRSLAEQPQPALPAPAGRIVPGAHYAGARALHARLVELGDLPAAAPAPVAHVYDDALAEGVARFQSRHNLAETGVLDAATVRALNVPLARRVHSLELTLERLRWLPDLPKGPMVAVDLPSYRLWAFDRAQPARPGLEMRVIVGRAVKTPTPVFIGQMRYLEFNPYWNVPRSITLKEIIPKLQRDAGYLARENMEMVGAGGVTTQVDASTLAALRSGSLRVRQRPGPRNALGPVKFAMPNPDDIYLHSTPQRELFRRARRDLSHGCIRVQDPAELARFVLDGSEHWDLDQIQAAMQPGPTRRVDLPAPVPVVLFYATAIATRDGRALFARDIYRRDPLLEQALRKHEQQARDQIMPARPGPTE